jgi:hypothetical protein
MRCVRGLGCGPAEGKRERKQQQKHLSLLTKRASDPQEKTRARGQERFSFFIFIEAV